MKCYFFCEIDKGGKFNLFVLGNMMLSKILGLIFFFILVLIVLCFWFFFFVNNFYWMLSIIWEEC